MESGREKKREKERLKKKSEKKLIFCMSSIGTKNSLDTVGHAREKRVKIISRNTIPLLPDRHPHIFIILRTRDTVTNPNLHQPPNTFNEIKVWRGSGPR